MPQIIDDPGLTGHFSNALGTGLQQLINDKVTRMKAAKGLGTFFPQAEAEQISNLNPQMQNEILKAYLERGGGSLAQGQEGGLGEVLSRPKPLSAEAEAKIAQSEKKYQHQLELEKKGYQDKLAPFLKGETANFKTQRELKSVVEDLLANLEKNKGEFPGALLGNLPETARNILLRNKNVRKYIADANKAVILAAQTRKGVPSNYKIRMEQLAKGDISQPIEAQEEIWKSFLDTINKGEDRYKFIRSQRDKKGFYPEDIEQEAADFELSQDNPLEYPQFFDEGTDITDENTGKRYILKNGEWQEVG
jgi:hypothetical protein